jgi:hypothetical protein
MKMVVGDDITLCDVPWLVGRALVGSFIGKVPREKSLTGWMNNLWKSLIEYTPKVHILSRNWISLSFLSAKDCNEIRKHKWSWGPSGLTPKPWTVNFDPLKESMAVMKVWEILLGFPLVFLSREYLESIGNQIGSYQCYGCHKIGHIHSQCTRIYPLHQAPSRL